MKIDANEIQVNGVQYVPKTTQQTKYQEGPIKIVVLQRGWVMVGYYKRDGDNCTLQNAAVLRSFGTTKGLGEIAASGPTSSTKLDPCNGLVEFHRLTEVATITCKESAWASKLV